MAASSSLDLSLNFYILSYEKIKQSIIERACQNVPGFGLTVKNGFTRIRHYGILASAFKAAHKANIDSQIGQVVLEIAGTQARLVKKCPYCKTGELHTVACLN